MTVRPARQPLASLIDEAGGRAVCLALSKDPNAKATVLLFARTGNQPRYVAKVPTTDQAEQRVLREAAALASVGQCDLGPAGATVPRLVTVAEHHGRAVLVTTALPGRTMLAAYHSWRHTARPAAVRADLAAAGRWLAAVQDRTAAAAGGLAEPVDEAAAVIADRFRGEPGLAADLDRLAGLRGRLAGLQVPQVVMHGDFWPGNLLLDRGGVRGVIDWEGARLAGPATRDLARFVLAYAFYLDRHTRPGRRVAGHPGLRAGPWGAGVAYLLHGAGWFAGLAQGLLAGGLRRLGVPPGCWRDVLLTEIACTAAEADHPGFARDHLHLLRRVSTGGDQ